MKLITTTLVALLATASVAFAADLPSKTAAPAVAAAAPASVDSISFSYGQDFVLDSFGTKDKDTFAASYTHKFDGGFSAGAAISTSQSEASLLKQNIEVQAGYAMPAFSGVALSGKVGIGERFTTDNFTYYAVYGAADYKVNDDITLNALSYRYRNAFDTANDYESHQLATGVTYALNKTYSVSAKIARNYDADFNETGDAATVGLTIKF